MFRITSGETINFSVNITDINSNLVDPTGLTFVIKKPDNTSNTYTYLTDAALLRDSTGKYSFNIILSQVGKYKYSWKTSAPHISIKEDIFEVVASLLA